MTASDTWSPAEQLLKILPPSLSRPFQVIESMGDLDAAAPMLARLGRSHAALGARPESFAAMGDCLMEELAASLKLAEFPREVELAWRAIFDAISAAIISQYPSGVPGD